MSRRRRQRCFRAAASAFAYRQGDTRARATRSRAAPGGWPGAPPGAERGRPALTVCRCRCHDAALAPAHVHLHVGESQIAEAHGITAMRFPDEAELSPGDAERIVPAPSACAPHSTGSTRCASG